MGNPEIPSEVQFAPKEIDPGVHTFVNQEIIGMLRNVVNVAIDTEIDDPLRERYLAQVDIFTGVLRRYNDKVVMRSPYDRAVDAISFAANGYTDVKSELLDTSPYIPSQLEQWNLLRAKEGAFRASLMKFRQEDLIEEIDQNFANEAARLQPVID